MKNLLVLQDYPKLLDALSADSSAVGCSVDFGLATLFILSNDGKLCNYVLGKCLSFFHILVIANRSTLCKATETQVVIKIKMQSIVCFLLTIHGCGT